MQGNRNNPFNNSEGYPNPTAYGIIKEETDLENKCTFLIKVLKFIIRESGFVLLNRIEVKDIKSGRMFK